MKKKYRSAINKRIFNSLKRISVCVLVLALFAPVVAMRGTNAGFLDEEKSGNNIFDASTLDFSVSSAADFSPKVSPSMETTRTISIANEGLENFQYRISAGNFSGDTDLCDVLEIKDDLDDTFQSLNSYISSSTDNSTKTSWDFTIHLTDNDDALADLTCDFEIVIEAWQTGLAYGAGGFIDLETVSSSVESEHWTNIADHLVINEVYYDVDSSHGSEPNNEWIEIYNPTFSAVNIRDWQICDNGGCDTLASSDLDIPANGYAVVTQDASTWGYWTVPGSAVKIVLGSPIGSGLSNTGDRLILRDDGGIEIDAMSYGTDTTQLNPACPDVAEGDSLARKPAGQDLDINSDFEDLSSPNPGTNPHTVVMNEIMPSPVGDDDANMPNGEWVELYNYGKYDIELKEWKLVDGDGDELDIKDSNTDTGSTKIKAGEKLVIYRNGDSDFNLNDDGDAISLIDEKGLIKDTHEFEVTPEGKTIARFPDAVGPWIDPDGTPGEENKMGENELDQQILSTFEECFNKNGRLKKGDYKPVCQSEYLQYLGLIKKLNDKWANIKLVKEIKDKLAQTELDKKATEEEEVVAAESKAEGEVIIPKEDQAENLKEKKEEKEEESDNKKEETTSEEDETTEINYTEALIEDPKNEEEVKNEKGTEGEDKEKVESKDEEADQEEEKTDDQKEEEKSDEDNSINKENEEV